jgi:methylmalonyl-CoA/ethylmalonyl-CoA epimerase
MTADNAVSIAFEWVKEPAPPHPFEVQPHHFALSVPDLEASIAWYRDILGFALEARYAIAAHGCQAVFLRRGSARLELFQVQDANPLPPERRDVDEDLKTHGAKHFSLSVPDVRAAFDFFRSRGVDIAMDVMEVEGTVAGYIRDNSGILVELTQPF